MGGPVKVTLVVMDKTSNDAAHVLEDVSSVMLIDDLKKNIISRYVKHLKPEEILLYLGSTRMEENRSLAFYNKSKRTKFGIDCFRHETFKIKVKALQVCKLGANCVCIPLWALCCRQTFAIELENFQTIGDLKKAMVDRVNDPKKLTMDTIDLRKGSDVLDNPLTELKDLGFKNGTTVDLLVKPCWFAVNPPQPNFDGPKQGDKHQNKPQLEQHPKVVSAKEAPPAEEEFHKEEAGPESPKDVPEKDPPPKEPAGKEPSKESAEKEPIKDPPAEEHLKEAGGEKTDTEAEGGREKAYRSAQG